MHALFRRNHFALLLPNQVVLRQFQQETARLRSHQLAVLTALFAQGKSQFFLRAGDTYVGKTALFIDVVFINAALVRQQPLFHTNQVDIWEFQPFDA
ncbi:Uncharacterised protein [Klebsiella michiganensis]|nr:Uncharacterised protein [Klebsiella michiganensis]